MTTSPTLIKNFVAGTGGVRQFRLVVFGAADGEVIEATAATQSLLGVSCQPGTAAAGQRADVALNGIADVEAGAAITRGALLTSDAQGRVIAATASAGSNVRIIGVAMVSAGAAGDIIQALLEQGSFQG